MNLCRSTIFALATPPGRSGLAVIRLSGSKAKEILERLTQGKNPKPRLATLCALYEPDNLERFDRALVLWFAGPASYTGEDVFELHLHGGAAVIEAASNALLSLGAEPAGPGEFTRRAFENGKLDLVQAEAVADLIDAQTKGQLLQAQRQLGGQLGVLYGTWREQLSMIRAQVEACIDFPEEEDVLMAALTALEPKVAAMIAELDAHLQDNHRGERVREGMTIALIGPVNAGKSTLLNRLAGEDVAIVSDEPGTTRDVVRVRLNLGGFLVELADTAGLRTSTQAIEKEGIKRSYLMAKAADIRMFVLDATHMDHFDEALADIVHKDDIIVLNKRDLLNKGAVVPTINPGQPVSTYTICAKSGEGVEALLSAVQTRVVDMLSGQESPSLTRARHRRAVIDTQSALGHAITLLESRPELAGEHLREAGAALGQITGEAGTEEILGKIFSAFCIGK